MENGFGRDRKKICHRSSFFSFVTIIRYVTNDESEEIIYTAARA
jgi:hypothetical protein